MKRVPFTMFGQTKMVPHKTWTNNRQDTPAKDHWVHTLWVERGEDWYGLMTFGRDKTVLVVDREDFLSAPDVKDNKK